MDVCKTGSDQYIQKVLVHFYSYLANLMTEIQLKGEMNFIFLQTRVRKKVPNLQMRQR